MRHLCVPALALALLPLCLGAGAKPLDAGVPLQLVIEELRAAGYKVVFSRELVGSDLVTGSAQDSRGLLEYASAELRRHGLRLKPVGEGALIVTRIQPARPALPRDLPGYLDEVVVTPDRFDIAQEGFEETRRIDAAELADTPLRVGELMSAVESLPGVAIGSEEAAPRIRGTTGRDVLFLLDGFEIYQPYHLPDFRSPFSLVDPDSVDEMTVHTGGMPAHYGDRYGGLIEIETSREDPELSRGVALGSASSRLAWGARLGAKSQWSIAARAWYPNGVIDTVDVGDDEIAPRMSDVFAKFQTAVGTRGHLSLEALAADDSIHFASAEGDELVDAAVESRYAWTRWVQSWSTRSASETVLGVGRIERRRAGESRNEGEIENAVRDDRTLEFTAFSQRFTFRLGENHLLETGFDMRRL